MKKKAVVEGSIVLHKEHGEGMIKKPTEEKAYITFSGKQLFFSYPEAFEKEYLKLK